MDPEKGRQQDYKNYGKNPYELRNRRHGVVVKLRKNKREEAISQRRNVPTVDDNADEDNQLPTSQLFEAAGDATNPEKQLAAVHKVRVLVSAGKYPLMDDLIKNGFFKILVDCLEQHNHTMLQFEATWALTNIACKTFEHTNEMVAAGAVPLLIQLLSSPAANVREQAVWALGNMLGHNQNMRDLVIQHGVVQPLLSVIKPDIPPSCLLRVTRAIWNLCRNKDAPLPTAIILQILPALNMLIDHTTNTKILNNTVFAISCLSNDVDQIQMVIESGIIPKLIPLLGHRFVTVQKAALRAVRNIAAGSDEQVQVLLNGDALSYFPNLLSHIKKEIRKDALWILSNITAGNESQMQAVINTGLLPKIIEHLSTRGIPIQKHAAMVIKNLIKSSNWDQLCTLITEGGVQHFCGLLSSDNEQIQQIVLEGIHNMYKLIVQSLANTF